MKVDKDVGILGWGAYIPMYRIRTSEIARVWGDVRDISKTLFIEEKAVAGMDENATTMSVEAAENAIKRAGIDASKIGAIFVGSESTPYAVKAAASTVAEAIGATPYVVAADFEFACKAGTDAIICCLGLVSSGMVDYAMGIGADTAQGAPGDALEYSAASGAAAFIISKGKDLAARIDGVCSYVTDTPDFWRRQGKVYPKHGEAFTGEPAYFRHIESASRTLMEELGLKPSDFKYAVFHQPNGKFPRRVAKRLGFTEEQIKQGLLSPRIGNTYAAATPIGIASILDVAEPGDRILAASFGSGAGSDAMVITVLDGIEEKRNKARTVEDYIKRRVEIDYGVYVKFRGKIKLP
ncbi:MAG: hydroxymethylglutaryl-CoA synthase [Candidatus Asgardarchaeia archaeon]